MSTPTRLRKQITVHLDGLRRVTTDMQRYPLDSLNEEEQTDMLSTYDSHVGPLRDFLDNPQVDEDDKGMIRSALSPLSTQVADLMSQGPDPKTHHR